MLQNIGAKNSRRAWHVVPAQEVKLAYKMINMLNKIVNGIDGSKLVSLSVKIAIFSGSSSAKYNITAVHC